MKRILINQSYIAQRVTGQQRYASEIARRLEEAGATGIRPGKVWSNSKILVWAWVQLVFPLVSRGATVLSLTSRAPFWFRRQVVVVHDLFVLTNPEWYSRLYVWTHAPLLRAQLRSAAAVVAVSQPVADQVSRLRSEPVQVAPNAPSDVFRRPHADEEDAALARRGLEPDRYFLAVGSRDPRKNLPRLVEAYGRLSHEDRLRFPLVVVGGGAAIYRDECIDWPVGSVDAGYVPDDELRVLYRHARSFVFVTRAEGFGLPLVEAAAAGCRHFVVSDIEVFRWVCGENARYTDPTSVADIAGALRREIDDPEQQELDLERFDWDASAAVIEDVCRRVSGDRCAGSPDHRRGRPRLRRSPEAPC